MARTIQMGQTIVTIEHAWGSKYRYHVRADDHRTNTKPGAFVDDWREALRLADELGRECNDAAERNEQAQRANGIIN